REDGEARDEPGDDRERPPAAARRAAGEHDREHGEDARRDGGDDAREQPDAEQHEHLFPGYGEFLTSVLNRGVLKDRLRRGARRPRAATLGGVARPRGVEMKIRTLILPLALAVAVPAVAGA